MRKLLVTLSALFLVAPISVPAAAGPGAAVGGAQEAIAMWASLRGATGTFYGAVAERTVHPQGGIRATALIVKGTCRRERTGHLVIVYCSGRGTSKEVPLEDFGMDPLLSQAALTVRTGGYVNQISWTGRGRAPQVFGGVGGDDSYLEAGAGMGRAARATGRIYGTRITRSWHGFADLMQGAGAAGWTGSPNHSYRLSHSADGVSLEYRFVLGR